ncbi:hypothetical protein [Nonomuraea sp. NPDC050540]|uniref:hypothetical protein n=1 Tax=Nonomuraea sp. NPDC050540 TaxID=3364367 RepID=UPI003788F1A9
MYREPIQRQVTRPRSKPAEQENEQPKQDLPRLEAAPSGKGVLRRPFAEPPPPDPLPRLRAAVREVEKQPPAPRRTEQAQRLLTEVKGLAKEARPARRRRPSWPAPQDELSSLKGRLEAVITPPASPYAEKELTVGRQDAGGVTVEETVLDGRTRRVDIGGSCGIVIGDRNRQNNHFHYEVADRPVSLPELLTATPAHKRALANLIKDPTDARSTRAMSALLERQADRLLSGKRAVSTRSEPKRARLTGVLGPSGDIVVHRSRGVVIGRGNVQNNHFHYRLERPDALLARSLAQNSAALQRIAKVYGRPGDRSADRDLGAMLAKLITAKKHVERIAREPGAPVERIYRASGITIGTGNVRTDTVHAAPPDGRGAVTVWDQSVPNVASSEGTRSSGPERHSSVSRNLSRDR